MRSRRIGICTWLTATFGWLVLVIAAGPANAQWEHRTSRGATGDAFARLDAGRLLEETGTACDISGAEFRGRDHRGVGQYEVSCNGAPGYLLIDESPPRALDCFALAGSRMRNPNRRTPACGLPGNQNPAPYVIGLAREAGIMCAMDEGAVIGRTFTGSMLYEVGCEGEEGYWLERSRSRWSVKGCMRINTEGQECLFTSEAENVATVQAWLPPEQGCQVDRARYMGANARGAFYEALCRSGEGYAVRVDAQRAVQGVVPCDEARRLGDGCRWTGGE